MHCTRHLFGFFRCVFTPVAVLFSLFICISLCVYHFFSATLATVVRDYYQFLEAGMRMMFFLSPIIWAPDSMDDRLLSVLQLNPFYYILNGFRDSFIGGTWFFLKISHT